MLYSTLQDKKGCCKKQEGMDYNVNKIVRSEEKQILYTHIKGRRDKCWSSITTSPGSDSQEEGAESVITECIAILSKGGATPPSAP